jgi:hypothetical protein
MWTHDFRRFIGLEEDKTVIIRNINLGAVVALPVVLSACTTLAGLSASEGRLKCNIIIIPHLSYQLQACVFLWPIQELRQVSGTNSLIYALATALVP